MMGESKSGKKEAFLTPIDKQDRPLGTYHVGHVGPMEQTAKSYSYIFVVVDAFSKFTWLYPTRTTAENVVIDRIKRQASVFGNPKRIISDHGAAFMSNSFKEYCEAEEIEHLVSAIGVPGGNGQVEHINKTIIPMLSKLYTESPDNWYKHIERVQQTINNTPPRSTKLPPFKLLTWVEMEVGTDPRLSELLEEAAVEELEEERESVR